MKKHLCFIAFAMMAVSAFPLCHVVTMKMMRMFMKPLL